MAASTKKSQSLVQIGLVSTIVVTAGKLDGAPEELANQTSRGFDTSVLVGNVVLQTSALIDGQLGALVNRATETPVILACIQVIRVVLGVVNVLFGATWLVSGSQRAG